jgi:hypothetical protein
MVLLQFTQEAFICYPGLLQTLTTHAPTKGGDEIASKILVDAGFDVQSTGDLKRYSLDKLCGASGILQFPFDVTVGPGP